VRRLASDTSRARTGWGGGPEALISHTPRRAGGLYYVGYPADKTAQFRLIEVIPLYHFAVHNSHVHDEPEGTELPDDEAARQWGLEVIRDLKKNNESMWKGWTIEVTDGDRQVWQIPFIGEE
jgi:hypothetical protein